jgi:hypothetical protein
MNGQLDNSFISALAAQLLGLDGVCRVTLILPEQKLSSVRLGARVGGFVVTVGRTLVIFIFMLLCLESRRQGCEHIVQSVVLWSLRETMVGMLPIVMKD